MKNSSIQKLFCGVDDAAWGNGGIFFASNNSLFLRELPPPYKTSKIAVVGYAHHLRWSSNTKHLRFSVDNAARETTTLWELAEPPRRLEYLEHGQGVVPGSWSPNGQYFVYDAGDGLAKNIWVEKLHGLNPRSPRSFQLTHGPGSWQDPTAGDASKLFAIHNEHRPALVYFNSQTNRWEDMWDGSPDLALDYSPDRQWVAFMHEPDHTIWKSRPDGSERVQLTAPSRDANQPHWSHDGQRIAFMGQNPAGAYRVFVVPANGGAPEELQPDGPDQGVPTWSPDDSSVLFGEWPGRRSPSEMCLHTIDLRSRRIQAISGTNGLWSPRWSTDGKNILAVTTDRKTIRISPADASRWTDVVSMALVDDVMWSYDSRYIYFNGRLQPTSHFVFYRVQVATRVLEKLVDSKGPEVLMSDSFGITPDVTLLGSKDYVREEICEIDCKLP